ncbi:MAG: 2OG-Fe(II) oxygenase [Bacteroidota bacterium]
MNFLNSGIDLKQLAQAKKAEYQTAQPFPNIVIDDFFDPEMLSQVLADFPDLSKKSDVINYDNQNEKKLAAKGEMHFSDNTKAFVHFLNSQPVLEFLQELTGIKETLLPDPYLLGGGYHEIKPGGMLKIHADFNKHELSWIDRRINLLVYLNKDWDESYGGHFELWDKDMTQSYQKILPVFNRIAIFSTTDFSFHGHPNALTCPPDRSRKSLALYYYSNGRPKSEISKNAHATIFKNRAGVEGDTVKDPLTLKDVVRELTPPIIYNTIKKMVKGDR